jgi:oligoribonuclease NrnB/cAMP/cGMP phosphodiesterase (DHH superfamily)
LSKPLVIYHSNCQDGFTAAWAVWLSHPDWEFYPGVHGEPPPDVTGRVVYMVDFSYKRPVLLEIAEHAESITILDHHKTAAADLDGIEFCSNKIEVKFDMDKSGARLAWECFHPREDVPNFVTFVEDRDLWRFTYDETRPICAAIFSHDYSFEQWSKFNRLCQGYDGWMTLVKEGEAIERKQQKDIAELLPKLTYNLTIGGTEVPAVNLPYQYASDAGHILSKDAPFAAVYYFDGKHYKFSLRSGENGADVSEIAKRYGGGGHKHAAGFQVISLEDL